MPKNLKNFFIPLVVSAFLLVSLPWAQGQWDVTEDGSDENSIDKLKDGKMDIKLDTGKSVEMQADSVQYSSDSNVAKAVGNVVIKSGESTLYADQVQLDRSTQVGNAQGHVYLDSPQFQVDADAGRFKFTDQTGEFQNARIWNAPFVINGRKVDKVSDTHMIMENGYLTTCDHDEPHYRLHMRRMDFYQGDKAVARGIKIYAGRVPVMYLPRYTQDLKNQPWFTFAPGHDKDLGYFLLTRSRFKINDYWTTTLRLDAYERTGFAWGSENKYRTSTMGSGLVRTYFINERLIAANHPWNIKTEPTVQNERYKVEWRHKWDIDDTTQTLWQYYRFSDPVILPRYFEQENRRDPDVSTYFLLTKALPVGSLTFRVDRRVNRFTSAVDRTPDIGYSVVGKEFGESGLYINSTNSFANLVKREASPTEDRRKTVRVNTNNDIYYPAHIAFVQFTPHVGGDFTYYSRTNDRRDPTKVVRSMFQTGADLSTRSFKVFDMPNGLLGTDLKRFRHIIAPTISYRYQHKPTFAASRLNQFDGIDALDQAHSVGFSIENKLQTKVGKQVVDLIRDVVSFTYNLEQNADPNPHTPGSLSTIQNQLEITPTDWLKIYSDVIADHRKQRLAQSDFDVYVKVNDRFSFSVGDSFVRGGQQEIPTQVSYIINPKWKFRVLNRFLPSNHFSLQEQDYMLTRDLHEWEVSFMYNNIRGSGTEVLVTFKLKAFPDQPFDLFGTTFHKRKAGSQHENEIQTY